ncbi:MAG: SpoIIE family protein phosphatase [Tatlockia sp.]|nr:SpoIIE family protein phosphatase [Tatlockia sp.]
MTISLKQIQYDVIFEALEGETVCGDHYLIKELRDSTLLMVVDGLGHGPDAAHAAKTAIETVDAHAAKPIETLFELCHQALNQTRGAAITIVKLDLNYNMTYKAIGNVMGVHWHIDERSKLKQKSFLLEGGIVGYELPLSSTVREVSCQAGDTIIIATDGLKNQFETEPPRFETSDKIAEQLFSTYRNKKDDGLVLVARLT